MLKEIILSQTQLEEIALGLGLRIKETKELKHLKAHAPDIQSGIEAQDHYNKILAFQEQLFDIIDQYIKL